MSLFILKACHGEEGRRHHAGHKQSLPREEMTCHFPRHTLRYAQASSHRSGEEEGGVEHEAQPCVNIFHEIRVADVVLPLLLQKGRLGLRS